MKTIVTDITTIKNEFNQRIFENPVFGDKITILINSEQTNGTYSLYEVELKPGGRNMLHIHSSFDETFEAVNGLLGVYLEGKNLFLLPGESVTAKKKAAHYFFNPGEKKIRFRIRQEPAPDGFENALRILYGLARDGKVDKKGIPKNLTHLAILSKLSDSKVIGVVSLLTPLFKCLARRAEKNGIEKALFEKYCP